MIQRHRPENFMPAQSHHVSWKLIGVIVWLVATVSLAGWWLRFGLNQLSRISQLGNDSAQDLVRQHRMLMSEGGVLLLLLLGGGITLAYLVFQETRRSRAVREFFAAFTHDLKTSLASLRLQAEALGEDLRGSAQSRLSDRLVKDTVRLELQLENSLFVASPEAGGLFIEELRLQSIISSVRLYWPQLRILNQGDADIMADRRALESILKNILQNAVVHGAAEEVTIAVRPSERTGYVKIRVSDNGVGFKGHRGDLGKIFHRHAETSGSGIGLHLVRKLAQAMRGEVEFIRAEKGFVLEIELLGRLV